MENAPTEYGKCNTCKEEKDTIAFGQCDECFEKEMEKNGSVTYGGEGHKVAKRNQLKKGAQCPLLIL